MIAAGTMIASMIPAVSVYADESKGEAPDYSKKECWCKIPEITKDVDTFYIYATEYIMGSLEDGAPEYATLDNDEMIKGAESEYIGHATAYADSTNVFMPYYRQAGMPVMKKAWKETGDCEAAITGMPYDDITAALDYYFENYNEGRPFIIAGHSQGSCMTKLLLKKYFKDHPEYYDRMVAAYVIGYSVTKDDLEANPHLKFATGETDTGVIISYNTEGPKNAEEKAETAVLLPNAISINPLNWKLDETYAPASENLGSLVVNEKTGKPEKKGNRWRRQQPRSLPSSSDRMDVMAKTICSTTTTSRTMWQSASRLTWRTNNDGYANRYNINGCLCRLDRL